MATAPAPTALLGSREIDELLDGVDFSSPLLEKERGPDRVDSTAPAPTALLDSREIYELLDGVDFSSPLLEEEPRTSRDDSTAPAPTALLDSREIYELLDGVDFSSPLLEAEPRPDRDDSIAPAPTARSDSQEIDDLLDGVDFSSPMLSSESTPSRPQRSPWEECGLFTLGDGFPIFLLYQVMQDRGCNACRRCEYVSWQMSMWGLMTYSVDATRDIPASPNDLQQSIVSSLWEWFSRWQGQPRDEYQWACYYSELATAEWYDSVETAHWLAVEEELQYLQAWEESYRQVEDPRKRRNTAEPLDAAPSKRPRV